MPTGESYQKELEKKKKDKEKLDKLLDKVCFIDALISTYLELDEN